MTLTWFELSFVAVGSGLCWFELTARLSASFQGFGAAELCRGSLPQPSNKALQSSGIWAQER